MFLKAVTSVIIVCILMFKTTFYRMPYPKIDPNLQTRSSEADDRTRHGLTSIAAGRDDGDGKTVDVAEGTRPQAALSPETGHAARREGSEASVGKTNGLHGDDSREIVPGGPPPAEPAQGYDLESQLDGLREQMDSEKLKNQELLLSIAAAQDQTDRLEKTRADLEARLRDLTSSESSHMLRLENARIEILSKDIANFRLRDQLSRAVAVNERLERYQIAATTIEDGSGCAVGAVVCRKFGFSDFLSLPINGEAGREVASSAIDGPAAEEATTSEAVLIPADILSNIMVDPAWSRLEPVSRGGPSNMTRLSTVDAEAAEKTPSGLVTVHIVISYEKGSLTAQARAAAVDSLLESHGFDVNRSGNDGHAPLKNDVSYFYAEDRGAADRIAGILASPHVTQKRARNGRSPPQPGTIEIEIAGS